MIIKNKIQKNLIYKSPISVGKITIFDQKLQNPTNEISQVIKKNAGLKGYWSILKTFYNDITIPLILSFIINK